MILDREKLKKDGYLVFNLKDVDPVLYESAKQAFEKNELTKFITSFRADGTHYGDKEAFSQKVNKIIEIFNFQSVSLDVNEFAFKIKITDEKLQNVIDFENKFDTLVKTYNQKWYFADFPALHNDIIIQIYENTLCKLYEAECENYTQDLHDLGSIVNLTMFRKSNFIENHADGINKGIVCSFLMYLNDDYQEGFGGELKLNDVIVKPTFGTIAILDFRNNNVPHEVLKVNDDNFLRFAFLRFPYETKAFREKQNIG